jgi:uncharacterized protein (TIGR02996 family)
MTEADFLRAIIAEPDDDVVRLAYCDWLEEHAGRKKAARERAEFVRGQVELARDIRDSPARRQLAFRVRQLLDGNGEKWLGRFKGCHEWHFHRGFVDKVGVSADTLKRHARRLFALAPLRRLWVTGLHGDVAPLRRIPETNTLTALDLCYNQLTSAALEQLTTFPALARLKSLGLMFNQLDREGAKVLRTHPFFQGLSLIRCGANPIPSSVRGALRRHFGPRVSFECERDDDHLYAIQDDYAFTAGFGKDDTQLLFRNRDRGVRLAIFDHEGNLLEVQQLNLPRERGSDWRQQDARRDAAKQAWMEELGFRSATIRVKRFHFDDGEGINSFNWWREAFDDPDHPQGEVREAVGHWLSDGQFEWKFSSGDNCWLDGNGEVTDT